MRKSFRRKSISQKPWNKVSRNEKFWVPFTLIRTAAQNQQFFTNGTPAYAFWWDPFVQATEQTATFNFMAKGLTRVKIHRIQGFQKLHCLATNTEAWPATAPFPAPFVALDYVWMVVDKAADTHDAASFPATSLNPSAMSSGDLYELLQRDDILSWGSVDVPRGNQSLNVGPSWQLADAGQFPRPRANLPFPRIGKMGLNIPRGKALACLVSARNVVDGSMGTTIDDGLEALGCYVNLEGTYRLLCS